ncbi:MAG: hypothetical protein JWO40_703 [Candidatus Doudnabacteria bacterium]|nr:hypothetical protein [Candidatus Doudnabacteria bacterium]
MKKLYLSLLFLSLTAVSCNKTTAPSTTASESDFAQIETCSPAQPQGRDATYADYKIIDNLKFYQNDKYHYSISYPDLWYLNDTFANDDFSGRNEENQCIGGDLNITNQNPLYSNKEQAIAADNLVMYIFKVNPKTTLKGFAKLYFKNDTAITTSEFSFNGTPGLLIYTTTPDNDNKSITQTWAVTKRDNQLFLFGSSNDKNAFNKVISSFKFIQ